MCQWRLAYIMVIKFVLPALIVIVHMINTLIMNYNYSEANMNNVIEFNIQG